MKTLLLLRHAKSEHLRPGMSDFDRALNERGRTQAQALGRYLKKQNRKIDLVLCSTAARARETTELVQEAAALSAEVRYEQTMYDANPLELLELVAEIEDHVSVALVVGHNPGMEQLLHLLTGRLERLSTCTLVQVSLDVPVWNGARESQASLDWIVNASDFIEE
jgi:phosphohistidine phosphatase